MSSHEPSAREQHINQVIADYLEAVETGTALTPEELLAQHPDIAGELKAFLADRERFKDFASPVTQAPPDIADAMAPTLEPEGGSTGDIIGKVRYFGDYELLQEIARGGMGVVYKARQTSLIRIVALKMILVGQLANAEDVRRFRTEAEAAARLDHPGIVPIFEVGQHEGQHYFSMAYVEGESLAHRVLRGVLPPRETAELTKKIAQAISYAHIEGVIHRDLKPANVLIDKDGQPRVTDFGLAKRVTTEPAAGSAPAVAEHTATGQVLGTPSYMPPEQAAGKIKEIGPLADVYSLGAILYCLLTGRPPFQAASPLDTLLQVLSQEPVPPRQLDASIPRDLETICLKCLEKEPRKRYASAQELVDELRRFLDGQPIRARPVGQVERGWRWCRRNPLIASLVSAVLVSIICGAVGSAWFAVEASRRAEEADENARQATVEKDRANEESERAGINERAARQSERAALHNLYVSQTAQAHLEWKDGQVGRVLDLLDAQQLQRNGSHDFRGFEWYYLRRLCEASHTILLRDQPPLKAVVCNRDGKMIASASGPLSPGDHQKSELRLWDGSSGKELRSLQGYRPSFSGFASEESVAFSPDGSYVAAFGSEPIRVWETSSGKLLRTFRSRRQELPLGNELAFSPVGCYIAAVDGKALKLWDVKSGKPMTPTLEAHSVDLTCVAFNQDGIRLVAGAIAGQRFFPSPTILLWDVMTGKQILKLNHPGGVSKVAVSPNDRMIAATGEDFLIRVWDVDSKKERWTLRGHRYFISRMAFSPDSHWLISGSGDGTIKVWDMSKGSLVRTLRGHTLPVTGLALSGDGHRLFSSGLDGTIRVWDWSKDQDALTLDEPLGIVASLAFHPDGGHLAAGSYGVSLWDITTGKAVRTYKEPFLNFPALAISFSHDGARLATGTPGIKVWDTKSGKKLFGRDPSPLDKDRSKKDDFGLFWGVAFSPSGKEVASCGEGLRVRDAITGNEKFRVAGDYGVAYSPDGRYVACGVGHSINLSNPATGDLIRRIGDFPDPVLWVSFSSDSQRLFAASNSRARTWSLPSAEASPSFRLISSRMQSPGGAINPARGAFSPDGERFAMGAVGDGTIRVWDTTTGQQTLALTGPASQITCVAFSPDGNWLAAGGLDGTRGIIRVWDARPVNEKRQ
jgi:WD40 repeat protein/serine/threonine protein kinase